METLYRLVSGAAAGIAALFAPIGPLVACAVVFILSLIHISEPTRH